MESVYVCVCVCACHVNFDGPLHVALCCSVLTAARHELYIVCFYVCVYTCVYVCVCVFVCAREEAGGREGERAREKTERKECYYGVATISRLLKMIGLFCRI